MNVYEKILKAKGKEHQLRKTMEECGELIRAVNKYIDNPSESNLHDLIEEGGDVDNMLHQLRNIFPERRKQWHHLMEEKKKRALENLR